MALGVLNNLSAIYAENNLNNTSNSLQKVLQQLSSGSRINSGADDAAGLSLVNGLQANSSALTQSATNATEGVGLLKVADGALSQVTNLLNRAITLATEGSNGTLNSSQSSAANQEYQSILAEINNIGSTTTYNQQQVFGGGTIAIYTGDSSTSGSSIDALNIRSLSASSVGDTGGIMAYSSGSSGNNVFLDLTSGATNKSVANNVATINDPLTGGINGTTTIFINTLSSSGAVVPNPITVGGSSGFANTAQGMINAINANNLGVTASFTTDKIAGSGILGDTGIMITGSVGVGSKPSSNSFSGSATTAGAADTDKLSGSITLQVGNGAPTTITMAQVAAASGVTVGSVSLDNLVSYINADAGLGVKATDGGQGGGTAGVLGLSSNGSTDALKVTSNLTDNSIAAGPAQLAYSAAAAYSDGITSPVFGSNGIVDSNVGSLAATSVVNTPGTAGTAGAAFTISGGVGVNGVMELQGTLTITGGDGTTQNIILGQAPGGSGGAVGTDTLAHLATTITNLGATSGFTAAYNNGTGVLTVSQTQKTGPGNNTTLAIVNVSGSVSAVPASANAQSATTADVFALGGKSSAGGIATISYLDGAGADLSTTDLTTQVHAQAALIALNLAITDAAAMDGYIGGQINTLNAVNSEISTQQENVVSAQNAIQATDYAAATSNMSKYEILSQTGIAALAQANSVEQEVTKLLQ